METERDDLFVCDRCGEYKPFEEMVTKDVCLDCQDAMYEAMEQREAA